MVRGNAKALAQAKNEKKAASKKEAKSDLKARGAALKVECGICKAPMINYHQLRQHYDSKHPKETCPPPECLLKCGIRVPMNVYIIDVATGVARVDTSISPLQGGYSDHRCKSATCLV